MGKQRKAGAWLFTNTRGDNFPPFSSTCCVNGDECKGLALIYLTRGQNNLNEGGNQHSEEEDDDE